MTASGGLFLSAMSSRTLADPGLGTGRAEFPNEQTDALVARLGKPEPLCDRPEPSMDLCDRLLSVVESPNRRDQPRIQARSRR